MLAWTPGLGSGLASGLASGLTSGLASTAPVSLLRMQRVPVLSVGDVSFVCNEAYESCKAVSSSLLDSGLLDIVPMCPWREVQFIELMDASKEQSYQEALALLLTCWGLLAVQLLWMSSSKK